MIGNKYKRRQPTYNCAVVADPAEAITHVGLGENDHELRAVGLGG